MDHSQPETLKSCGKEEGERSGHKICVGVNAKNGR